MPEISPFRALRYDLAKVGDLTQVVAPPYDVIDESLQAQLYDQSPYNIIRLEYNRPQADDTDTSNRYTRAAAFLRDWRRTGVLHEEEHPAFYVYDQVFEAEGQTHTRRGFFARVRLEQFGQGKIYPHEQTLSGPKADRLSLYRATGTQLSPIFGLYPDPDRVVLSAVEAGIRDRTPIEARDHLGVIHRIWPVYDQEAHTRAQGLIAELPVFIADGHHRYETGLAYRDELERRGALSGLNDPANFCCMTLVGMSDPGLIIMPTHRLVSGLSGISADTLGRALATEFDIQTMGEGSEGARRAWEEVTAWGEQNVLGLGTTSDGRWLTAHLRSTSTMDKLAADHSSAWRALGVSILHELVIKHCLATLGTPSFRYVHRLDEVTTDFAAKACDLACLVPPATMQHVADIARAHETMPPKSTYFYPKLLTGLVINSLR